jgi:hypothetical protein
MHIESWTVTTGAVVLFALVMVVVGLLARLGCSLCRRMEKCTERGDWPCRS